MLREMISPYLLRRMKKDVLQCMPAKTEQVLFCNLTPAQVKVYKSYLASGEVADVVRNKLRPFHAISVLRKVCNHPDLLIKESVERPKDYGARARSGKLEVVMSVLPLWKKEGHRVLLFSQTRQMLDIIEDCVATAGYVYRRLDGSTAIRSRMALIDEYNSTPEIFILLLTTKVGGIGVNLTGADRVLLYDPDWNPSTDMQARERAWRLGQTRSVSIYRLVSSGTIEEKIYHRQVFKTYLTDRVLKDPKQQRFFKSKDLRELFVLGSQGQGDAPETAEIFAGVRGAEYKESRDLGDEDGADDGEGEQGSGQHGDKEDGVLSVLLGRNGTRLRGALNHDAVVSSNAQERQLVEGEAERIAQRAAEALKKSRMMRYSEGVNVPTWTGQKGAAGVRFGPTRGAFSPGSNAVAATYGAAGGTPGGGDQSGSARDSLLSGLRNAAAITAFDRSGFAAPATVAVGVGAGLGSGAGFGAGRGRGRGFGAPPPATGPAVSHTEAAFATETMQQIREFLESKPLQRCRTQDILNRFNTVPPTLAMVFKAGLKKVAKLEGNFWVLKDDFEDENI